MAIRNVNGRNVYILEPRPATGRTTSGRNWATLYSDLRWQVWEEVQKNEAQMLKVDLASEQQKRDFYDDKVKVLRDQRKQLQAAALKAQTGTASGANRDAMDAAKLLERSARAGAGKIVTKFEPATTNEFGEVVPARTVTTKTEVAGGRSAEAEKEARRILSQEQAKREAIAAGAPAGETIKAEDVDLGLDSEIERLDREIEELLQGRPGIGEGVDTDLLGRTREAFGEQVGVIGEGGGPFGLARRGRRRAPVARAEPVDDFSAERAEVARLRSRGDELESIGLGGEGGEADMLYREAAQIERDIPTPTTEERLSLERPVSPVVQPEKDIDMVGAQRKLESIERGLEPLQEPVPTGDDLFRARQAEAEVLGISPEEFAFEPSPTQVEPLPEELSFAPSELQVEAPPEELIFGQEEVKVVEPEEISFKDKPVRIKPSTRQRKDKYKFDIVKAGTKLASQPKKLNRMAKTKADPEDRPQHLIIVDKLYETNRGKGDSFKMTYDEISRAFANNPSDRKEAHTYLVAKDILDSHVNEPLD